MTVLKNPSAGNQTESEGERQIITISGDKRNAELLKAVGKFNVSNDKYQVEVKQTDYDRLLVEIMTGEGPDLFSLQQIGTMECVNKGIVEDLTPYLENSELLSREMLNEKVLELCTKNGILTCVPPSYGISTLWGKASAVGDRPGWTMEEFLDCVDSNRGVTVMEGSMRTDSRAQMVLMIWHARQYEWVDWENKEARFDEGEFENLLNYAVDYEAKYDNENGETAERWMEEKVLLYTHAIRDIYDYLYLQQLTDGDLVAKGYPSQDGAPFNQLHFYGDFAISAKSENKEGAWAFIEFLAKSQTAEEIFMYGIPTLNSAYQEVIEEAVAGTGVKGISGVEIPPATEEDVEQFEVLLDNAQSAEDGYSVIVNILEEEITTCFSDGRSVEETIHVIQNRVQLYLDELEQ